MKFLLALIFVVATVTAASNPQQQKTAKHMVCFYNSSSFVKEGLGKLVIDDVEPALQFCDYLIYGYAGIDRESHKALSLNQNLDLDLGKGLYRSVTRLKRKYPKIKFLLSVGGGNDIDYDEDGKELSNKYLELLENPAGRARFISTAYALVKTYGFDGLDMSFQFNKNKPKKVHRGFGSIWKGFKKAFTGNHIIDENAEAHKEQFTGLLRELKNEFRADNFVLSVTILPNVNSSLFIDVPAVINYVDFINLGTFDFSTPDRNPDEADIGAPLYELADRDPEFNVNYQAQHWLRSNCPPSKINIGIATYGRPWKMTDDSGNSGIPPISYVENAAPIGINSQIHGLYSWPEVCELIPNERNMYNKGAFAPLRRVTDPARRSGTYAYRPADKNNEHGLWVSYEDPDTAADKAAYAVSHNLGGVALFDLSLDDFRGSCTGDKYPILRAIKYRLVN